jgi:hypothetical protein
MLLPGCLSLFSTGGIDRTIEGPYDTVFRATVTELRSRGFSFREVSREDGRIVTRRRTIPRGATSRPVETVEVYLERDGPDRTDLRLYLLFRDQVSQAPRRVPDRDDDGRADDVVWEALDRSFESGAVYDAYVDAIRRRVQKAGRPHE